MLSIHTLSNDMQKCQKCENDTVSYTLAGDVTRVFVMPRKVTVKIGDAENR